MVQAFVHYFVDRDSVDAAMTSILAAMTSAVDWPMSLAGAFTVLVGGALCFLQD
jgi:hypothetical protein